jgi:hypothetical protein
MTQSVETASVGPWVARINGGDPVTFETRGTTYCAAVAAIPAIFGTPLDEFPLVVEISVPKLVPAGYGPYHYYIHEVGGAAVSLNAFNVAVALGCALPIFFQNADADGGSRG